jgi:hypothetical protein
VGVFYLGIQVVAQQSWLLVSKNFKMVGKTQKLAELSKHMKK